MEMFAALENISHIRVVTVAPASLFSIVLNLRQIARAAIQYCSTFRLDICIRYVGTCVEFYCSLQTLMCSEMFQMIYNCSKKSLQNSPDRFFIM